MREPETNEQRQTKSREFLLALSARDRGPAEGILEASVTDMAEMLAPQAPIAEQWKPLCERTLGKISENQPLDADETFALEALIIPDKRPVIDVLAGNNFATDHPLWLHLNDGAAHAAIAGAVPAVGRIELPGHPRLAFGGTGFIVGQGLMMTNRHVAELFVRGLGLRGLTFLPGRRAAVDLEQRVDGGSRVFDVRQVLMIHPYWDMALLAVEGLSDIAPLKLAGIDAAAPQEVAAIGYPAFDPRNPVDVQREVFRDRYNVKRIMPGRFTGRATIASFDKPVSAFAHDSSTTGGASGSAVVDVASGVVVALHFGGIYMQSNYGVPAEELARDARVIDLGVNFAGATSRASTSWEAYWRRAEDARPEAAPPAPPPPPPPPAPRSVSVTLPLTITVTVGEPQGDGGRPAAAAFAAAIADTSGDIVPFEATAEDYRDRKGYDPDFLGFAVPLPKVVAAADDVLTFEDDGRTQTELRYQHFSVTMSRSRRMCFFSAVNIDGGQSRKAKRPGWRLDPRIPTGQQIINECYGNPPKFSRGHMTRREDPVWGTVEMAELGNADSMHVTNAVPQYQAFNSPIWLALEDHALDHAREDAMRISVFTGPYFTPSDPVMYGVRIPIRFWKVIAFIHDQTGRLCATGYEMSQQSVLPPPGEEFVFGEFRSPQLGITTQTALHRIEAQSGLSFGGLAEADPLANAASGFGESLAPGAQTALTRMDQIIFTT